LAQQLKARHPLVSKKTFFPFQVGAVCWVDLLGYGSMIAAANFNPLNPQATASVRRLRRFHEIVAQHSSRYFQTLTINDGAAAYRDVSLRNRSVGHDFLVRAWALFQELNAEEAKSGFPGARVVLAVGFRVRGRRAGFDRTSKLFTSILKRFQSHEISAEQAIQEAAAIRQPFDIVPQLQANFAFTKAYLAETGGKAAGLPGNNFYVDAMLFKNGSPPWMTAGPAIKWSNVSPPINGEFFQVKDLLAWKFPEGGPAEMLDGLEIAKRLSNDPNVLDALRKAKK
jgi:hypothetical protein